MLWKRSRDRKNRDIMLLIFAGLGDRSGNNASIASCEDEKILVFKLFSQTGMYVLNKYLGAKKEMSGLSLYGALTHRVWKF